MKMLLNKEKSRFLSGKGILLSSALLIATFTIQAQTEVTITIDTKLMANFNCNLNGNGVDPAPVNKVYMHSGACSENRGTNQSQSAEDYCADQILPFASDVWQHVVGNWGANPQDDGVGLMVDEGNGVYSKTFVAEDYYSDPTLVNTEQNSTGTTVSSTMVPGSEIYVSDLFLEMRMEQLLVAISKVVTIFSSSISIRRTPLSSTQQITALRSL
ncbi:MAG: hypothetical protein JKX84_09330 [Flavobacteriales bacterium]|nr:hypothetical protein [Flavobacteriales bacterium]